MTSSPAGEQYYVNSLSQCLFINFFVLKHWDAQQNSYDSPWMAYLWHLSVTTAS